MGIDVRELMRNANEQKQMEAVDEQPDLRMVLFTFMGREGLIEDGNNQEVEMEIDLNQNCEAQVIKQQLTDKFELVMDKGIFMVLRESQSG